MALPIVNSIEDLNAIRGTQQYAEFIELLKGSLWRTERDEENGRFIALEDDTTINRFGLTRGDFQDIQVPTLPEWTPLPKLAKVVSPLQAKAELLKRGLLDDVQVFVDAAQDPILSLAWNTASEFSNQSPLIQAVATNMGWDEAYLDDLFQKAAERVF